MCRAVVALGEAMFQLGQFEFALVQVNFFFKNSTHFLPILKTGGKLWASC